MISHDTADFAVATLLTVLPTVCLVLLDVFTFFVLLRSTGGSTILLGLISSEMDLFVFGINTLVIIPISQIRGLTY